MDATVESQGGPIPFIAAQLQISSSSSASMPDTAISHDAYMEKW